MFIAIPENTPDSVIFGTCTRPDKFKYINITCQNRHIKFEDFKDELPTFTWSADISGQDIENGPVDEFIDNLKPANRYLECPFRTSYNHQHTSNPITTAMWLLKLSGFYFPADTKVGKLDVMRKFNGVEARGTTLVSWGLVTFYLNSQVTEELVRESLKQVSAMWWFPTFNVDFQDGSPKKFTKKQAIVGGSALAAAGLGVTAVIYRRELQEFFKQGPMLVEDVEDNASLLISKLGLAIDLCQADVFDSKNVKFTIKDAIEQAGKLSQLNEDMQHKLNKIAR